MCTTLQLMVKTQIIMILYAYLLHNSCTHIETELFLVVSFKINLLRSKAPDLKYFSYNKKKNTLYLKFIKEKYVTSGACD